MGEYLPPPTILLALAAYVERELPGTEVAVLDCQAESLDWKDMEKAINSHSPDIVASSGFTCNAYACARTAELAKEVNSKTVTVMGGQHFSFTAQESLADFPEIDFIVRGEGENTFTELLQVLGNGGDIGLVKGLSFRHDGNIVHTPSRELISNLDDLPYPAYHLVERNLSRYHFAMMAGKSARYMILEGSRGCNHRCSFCTQWKHWNGVWRTKTARRIADEMEHLHDNFGGEFLWLTDDNFGYRKRGKKLWEELCKRSFSKDVTWFFQARTDEIANNPELVAKLRQVGNNWILIGVESPSKDTLSELNKSIAVADARRAVKILNHNGILTQSMFIIGSGNDSRDSIQRLREFSLDLETELAIYTVLTPYPGTDIYDSAIRKGLIEDTNYAHYDMVHAIMPTRFLSRQEVQMELYRCYKAFYGSITRNLAGLFSKNEIKRRAYRHMAGKSVLRKLRYLM
jgi:anaerobic magnesium-protoporphyrin IX monomethyl ester cyclase